MLPPAGLQRVRGLLPAQKWVYARTPPGTPRWDTLRRRWQRVEDFAWAVEAMRRHGCEEAYQGRPYTVPGVGGLKYRTTGAPGPETIPTNRQHPIPFAHAPASGEPIARAADGPRSGLLLDGRSIADRSCRISARIVPWLTPKSAASDRKLLVAARARTAAAWSGASLPGRGARA